MCEAPSWFVKSMPFISIYETKSSNQEITPVPILRLSLNPEYAYMGLIIIKYAKSNKSL